MIWGEFEDAVPELAQLGRRRFEATRVALLGTLRKDGSPRISPIEPYLVLDHLLLGMLSNSHKALDLMIDPRCTLHSSVSDVNGSEGEFKVDARAVLITDATILNGQYRAWWHENDASEARVFSLDIASAAHVAWDITKGEMTVLRWKLISGLQKVVRNY
jgi:hypothetical protein